MALDRRAKVTIGIGIAALIAYLGYRWWKNKQASNSNTSTPNDLTGNTALGTNLNSPAPDLSADNSGLEINPAPVSVTVANPVAQPAPASTPDSVQTGSGTVTVPNVTGMDLVNANAAAKAAGLTFSGPPSVRGKVTTVTGQSPAAGTKVNKGTGIKATSTKVS